MLTFGGRHSLWRSRNGGTSWERILTCAPGGADTLKFVGLPPRYGDACQTVFVAGENDGRPAVWQSTDDGQSYRCRFTRDPATGDIFPIDAWAIIDETSFFIAGYDGSRSLVYLTINGGFIYSEGIPAGSQPLSSLVLSPFYAQDGTLLAGNTDGRVYLYTGNGTAAFQPLPRDAAAPPLAGSVAVAFDPRFNKNRTLYAAGDVAGGGIYRFNTLTDEEWTSIDATLPAGAVINRLALGAEGTLYAADSSADGGMERCLFPASATDAEFETVTRYLPGGATLSGLWANDHYIWSVDSSGTRLLTFHDTLTAPAGQTSPVNRAAGIGSLTDHTFRNITIDWRALEGATSYQWQCDYTDDFSAVPDSLEGTTSASAVRLPALEPATRYHWRVRASAPVLSPWSEKWSFTTGLETEVITLKPESPSADASGVPVKPTFQWTAVAGASTYELLVAANADFDHPAVIRTGQYALSSNAWQCDVSLDYGTTYYWKVRAFGGSTSSAWSSTGVFTTGPAPANPTTQPVVPASSSAPLATTLPPHTTVPATNVPVASSLPQVKPAPSTALPQNLAALPSFYQTLELPVWAIYFISSLLVIVFLALAIILTMVLKIRRF
jgi:hypothetical protein